jgi:flagellar hook-associated protein 1 FlgK
MGLFSTIQNSANSLRVNELGLQVTGNNIANANTPGYLRQELVQGTAIGVRYGDVILGYGVRAIGVVQKVDEFVVERMRQATSELAYNQELQGANQALEAAFNELGENDLSSSMSRFSASFYDVANQPGNSSLRSLVLQRGRELANQISGIRESIQGVQIAASKDIQGAAAEINRLTGSIAELNRRIVDIEGGSLSNSDAVGLRDERIQKLDELAHIVNIAVREQESGAVTVIVGGDYLVSDGIARPVKVGLGATEDGDAKEIRFVDTDAPLIATGGRLRGYYEARDGVAATFINQIDDYASKLINQVNRLHSQGQGSNGFNRISSDNPINNEFAPLEQSGLPADIDNGSFVIQIQDERTGLLTSHDIIVKQQGFSDDTTPQSLVAQIDAIPGIHSVLTNDGRLEIISDSQSIKFSFAEDTSGALAAFGINTFFEGTDASDIQVKSELLENPTLLAVSLDGIGNGANNALQIAEVFDSASESLDGLSLREIYEGLTIETIQQINAQRGVTEGLQNYYRTLEAQHFSVSGVSLDEEAIKMMLYQRAFQATSKLITTASELFDTLVNMV